ncbi:MAG: carbohydrate-binding protein [Candidatus Brocadiia bacterium]
MTNDTTYYYVVTATDTSGNESGYSNEASATPTDTTAPAAPTNLSATAGDGQGDLDWDGNTEGDLASYSVYRSTTSGSGYSSIATGVGSSTYTDNSVTNGTTYYYVVTAVDTSSNESNYSNEASATPTASGQSPYGGTARSIPGVIEAEDYDEGGEGVAYHDSDSGNNGGDYRTDDVDVQTTGDSAGGAYNVGWAANGEWLEYTVNVTGGTYDIEARVASTQSGRTFDISLDGTNLGTVNVPNTGAWQTYQTVTLSDVTVSGGDGQILRLDLNGDSININWIEFVEAGGDTTPPAAPTGLTATAASDSQIDLDWDDNGESDLDSYNVYRDGSQIATGVASSSYSDTGLSASTQYCYTVTAVDTSGNESTESAQDCATTQSGGGGSVTLNPTADTNDNDQCTGTSIAWSDWCNCYTKFDLSSVGGSVTSATLRVYFEDVHDYNTDLEVFDATSDSWDECGTPPGKGSTLMDTVNSPSTGWYEFDVTTWVSQEADGDDVMTFVLDNTCPNWQRYYSRESSNPPELVVQW